MKNELIFLNRFNKFQDSLLEEVLIKYLENGTKTVVIRIYARDWSNQDNDIWLSIKIEFINVLSFKIFDDFSNTHQVISNGLSICLQDDAFVVELGDLADDITSISDLEYSNFFRG